MHHPYTNKRSKDGFTLIELMIAIAVLAILATIAISSYNAQLTKSNRAEATRIVLQVASLLERCRTENNSVSYVPCNTPVISQRGYYNLAVVSPVPGTTFTVTATPAPGTPPTADLTCQNFTLNQAGLRGVTFNVALPAAALGPGQTQANYCWGS